MSVLVSKNWYILLVLYHCMTNYTGWDKYLPLCVSLVLKINLTITFHLYIYNIIIIDKLTTIPQL